MVKIINLFSCYPPVEGEWGVNNDYARLLSCSFSVLTFLPLSRNRFFDTQYLLLFLTYISYIYIYRYIYIYFTQNKTRFKYISNKARTRPSCPFIFYYNHTIKILSLILFQPEPSENYDRTEFSLLAKPRLSAT